MSPESHEKENVRDENNAASTPGWRREDYTTVERYAEALLAIRDAVEKPNHVITNEWYWRARDRAYQIAREALDVK